MNIRLPQPPRPRPPDPAWRFGGIQRMALREACTAQGEPLGPSNLHLVENEPGA